MASEKPFDRYRTTPALSAWRAYESVRSREELVAYVAELSQELDRPELEFNSETTTYLEAVSGYVDVLNGLFINHGDQLPDNCSWGLLALILTGAINYD